MKQVSAKPPKKVKNLYRLVTKCDGEPVLLDGKFVESPDRSSDLRSEVAKEIGKNCNKCKWVLISERPEYTPLFSFSEEVVPLAA